MSNFDYPHRHAPSFGASTRSVAITVHPINSGSGMRQSIDPFQVEVYIVQLQQTMNEVLQRVAKLEGDKHE